jgi:hypothetical protein
MIVATEFKSKKTEYADKQCPAMFGTAVEFLPGFDIRVIPA